MQVGQTLWYVPGVRRGQPREIVVKKVGRVWAYFDAEYREARFDKATLKIDNPSGTLYLSQEQYEKQEALRAAWDELRKNVRDTWSVPDGVTINQIENAMRALFKRGADQSVGSDK